MSGYAKTNIFVGKYDVPADGHLRLSNAKLKIVRLSPYSYITGKERHEGGGMMVTEDGDPWLIVEDGDFWAVMVHLEEGDPIIDLINP